MKNLKYLSTGDVARYCEVNVTTVKRWIREGHLKGFQTPMGHFKVVKTDFIQFLKDNHMPVDESILGSTELKVLVIDDDPGMIKTIVMTLESLNHNLRVDTATDGYDGLMKIGNAVPNLLILDLNMPKIDGYEVIKRVKNTEDYKSAEIMVVSSTLNEETEKKLLNIGVSKYLKKPFKLSELKEEVTLLLGLNGN